MLAGNNFFNKETPIFTVTEFNRFVDQVLGQMFVSIRGEISDYKVLKNKWVSFEIKDEKSRLGCFMSVFELAVALEDGMEVKVTGRPGLYVPYGKYTFRVSVVELIGVGALKRSFELLKAKLEKEGLFKPEFKKPLPRFPRSIGLITSRDAAAYTDVLRILNNRWRGLEIYFCNVSVQGTNAPGEIVNAIEWFNKNKPVDLLIISRGGGSLEDLQAFNSENVVRGIFASRIPIVTGIGHERDITLADLVADVRASTPSNAAEIAVPDLQEIASYLKQMQNQLIQQLEHQLSFIREKLNNLEQSFFYVFTMLQNQLNSLKNRLLDQVKHQEQQIIFWFSVLAEKEKAFLNLHPFNILRRGYSITSTAEGRIITSFQEVQRNATIMTQLACGKIISKVEKTQNHG